jgi:hypothetical protein
MRPQVPAPILVLRYGLRALMLLGRAAARLDRALLGGAARAAAAVPLRFGAALSRAQSGSLTEYLLLFFIALALLVLVRLLA